MESQPSAVCLTISWATLVSVALACLIIAVLNTRIHEQINYGVFDMHVSCQLRVPTNLKSVAINWRTFHNLCFLCILPLPPDFIATVEASPTKFGKFIVALLLQRRCPLLRIPADGIRWEAD